MLIANYELPGVKPAPLARRRFALELTIAERRSPFGRAKITLSPHSFDTLSGLDIDRGILASCFYCDEA